MYVEINLLLVGTLFKGDRIPRPLRTAGEMFAEHST